DRHFYSADRINAIREAVLSPVKVGTTNLLVPPTQTFVPVPQQLPPPPMGTYTPQCPYPPGPPGPHHPIIPTVGVHIPPPAMLPPPPDKKYWELPAGLMVPLATVKLLFFRYDEAI